MLMALRSILSAASAFLGKIPPKVWLALGCALALLLGVLWHHHAIRKHDAALIAANNAQWQARLDALNAKIRAQDAQNAAMASQLRKANDEEHNRIAADAGSVLMHGPGKAVCPRISSPSTPASGSVEITPGSDAPRSSLSAGDGQDLSAVPWNWLVQRAQEHDDLLANEKAWREWYDNLVKAWPKQPAK